MSLIKITISAVLLLLFQLGCQDKITGEKKPPEFPRPVVFVPSQQPTIQTGINAASDGDTVLVAPGIYVGRGFRDILFRDKAIVLKSEGGPAATVLKLDGTESDPHLGFALSGLRESGVIIDGFTIRDGYSAHGAAISFAATSPTIKNCVFAGNVATVSGGGVRCKGSSPRFINCTFVNNSAPTGGGIYIITSSPVFENCIIAFSQQSEAILRAENTSNPTFLCSNIFGNATGDWTEFIADQEMTEGNASVDPLFCNPEAGNYHLSSNSPNSAGLSPCGTQVGALGVGCEP